jgi:2-desacetyl-2-hydroxyethyl bacteriochlorophyllide A dehydrogenase
MKALEWQAPEQLALVDREPPEAGPGQAVVAVANCGICGSDLHSYRHGMAAQPGQILGHEFCGTVLDAPEVDGLAPGDFVAVRPLIPCGKCDRCRAGDPQLCEAGHASNIGYGTPGGFAERVLVPRALVGETIFPLPAGIDDRAAALIEPLSVSLRAVRLADLDADDVVVVFGAGTIGLGATRFAALHKPGRLIVVDPSSLRRERALALGADIVVDPGAEDTTEVVRAETGAGAFGLGARADVVIDCAGAPAAFREALKVVRQGGTMVLCAMYGRKLEMSPDRITEKELTIHGSFAYKDEFPMVIDHLAAGDVDAELFISHRFPLAEGAEAFRTQLDSERSLKVLVSPLT